MGRCFLDNRGARRVAEVVLPADGLCTGSEEDRIPAPGATVLEFTESEERQPSRLWLQQSPGDFEDSA